jgi:hypothetical protein
VSTIFKRGGVDFITYCCYTIYHNDHSANQLCSWVCCEVEKMETAIVRIFEQHLDFLSPDVTTQLAKRFMAQFGDIYTRPSLEDVPAEELGKAHRFLVDELKQLVRGDPRLDLRYPDEAIVNVALLLVDDLVRVASPDRTMP